MVLRADPVPSPSPAPAPPNSGRVGPDYSSVYTPSASSSPSSGTVLMPTMPSGPVMTWEDGLPHAHISPSMSPVSGDEAVAHFWDMSPADLAKLEQSYKKAYGTTNKPSKGALYDYWKMLVSTAADANLGQRGVSKSPWDIAKGLGAGGLSDGGGKSGDGTTTSSQDMTQTTTDITDPTTAEGILRSVATQALGRLPTDKEIQGFVSALQSAQRANPNVTRTSSTTTTTTTGSGTADQQTSSSTPNATSETTGGTDPQVLAQKYAESRPDYAEYQTAKYMGLFQSMLGPAQGAVL